MREIKAFVCDHCNFVRTHKSYVKAHEKRCYHNPENRACASCAYDFNCKKAQEKPQKNCPDYIYYLDFEPELPAGVLDI